MIYISRCLDFALLYITFTRWFQMVSNSSVPLQNILQAMLSVMWLLRTEIVFLSPFKVLRQFRPFVASSKPMISILTGENSLRSAQLDTTLGRPLLTL